LRSEFGSSHVDEYGTLTGLITLEDIVEEIFGEIADEHDEEDFTAEQISDDTYLLSGRLEIAHINELFEAINLPNDAEYTTLSGSVTYRYRCDAWQRPCRCTRRRTAS